MPDKWITVKPNGPNNKGQPALIGGNGEIKAGMGGKFNGEKISEVRKDFTGAKTPKGLKESMETEAKSYSESNSSSSSSSESNEPPKNPDWFQKELDKNPNAHWNGQIYNGKKKGQYRIFLGKKSIEFGEQQKNDLEQSKKEYQEYMSGVKSESTFTKIPYDMKDDAREDGAKWDSHSKRWYFPKGVNIPEKYSRYIVNDGISVAFDKASARHKDENGHLIVDSTIITKAAVNPYYGSEIPEYERLGLDPNKIYNMLRDPEELKKGMPTFGEKQLLMKHIFVSADEPQKDSIAGTIGSNLDMVGDDVKGSLTVWDSEAINLIESGKLAELSASYFYDADMQSGTFKGQAYDGIMRNIRANHVALVERGRIGRDAIVADSMPKLLELNMKLKKGAFAKINAKAKEIGLVAMDADLTAEEIKALVGLVAEEIEDVALDSDDPEEIVGAEDGDEDDIAEDEQTQADRDNESEAMRLKEREKREEKDREADKAKAAMDSAIKSAEDKAVQRVTALFEARDLVKPIVGVVAMDSAEAVYKHALKQSGVDTTGVDNVAGLKSMVALVLKQKSAVQPKTAMDSSQFEDDELTKRFG
jgi:hypothetical protein